MSDPRPASDGELPDESHTGLEADVDETEVDDLQAARDEAASYLEDLKRVAADFENYRRRVAKESDTTLDRATERIVVGLMPVLDSFDAALTTAPHTDTERLLYSGMVNTRDQLLKALEAEGLEVISTVGEQFDPEIHEPIGAPSGNGTLVVSEELRRGYRLRSKVLRAALVMLETEE